MCVKSIKRRIHQGERDYKWGPTSQAPPEAVLAYETVYDASLGLGALREASSEELTAHCRKVAEAMPLVRVLSSADCGRTIALLSLLLAAHGDQEYRGPSCELTSVGS